MANQTSASYCQADQELEAEDTPEVIRVQGGTQGGAPRSTIRGYAILGFYLTNWEKR